MRKEKPQQENMVYDNQSKRRTNHKFNFIIVKSLTITLHNVDFSRIESRKIPTTWKKMMRFFFLNNAASSQK